MLAKVGIIMYICKHIHKKHWLEWLQAYGLRLPSVSLI